MLKSKEVKLGTGILLLCFATAINACTPAVKEGQPAINPSISPPAGNAKNEAVLTATPYSEVLRQNTPAEIAAWTPASVAAAKSSETPTAASASPAAAERPADTPTTQPTKKPTTATPFPPTKVPDTATAVPATKVPDKTPTALATPETNRFVPYGVYANEDTFVATLPDGRIIVGARKDTLKCSDQKSPVFNFITFSKYDPNKEFVGFNDPNGIARRIGVSLMGNNNELAMVTLVDKGYEINTPRGKITCPASEVKSKVTLVGEGKKALVDYGRKTGNVWGTDKEALEQLERMVGKLPD